MRSLFKLSFLLSSCLYLQACGIDPQADTNTPYLHRVETTAATQEAGYPITREFAGQVQSRQSSTIGFEQSGQVVEVLVNEGDTVLTGDVLARMDTELLQARVDEQQARAEEIHAELALTNRNLARIAELQDRQLASERERDELASRAAVLRAGLERIAAEQQATSVQLENAILVAPFDARIGQRQIDNGTVVNAGTPVLTLIEDHQREVRVGIPVRQADTLSLGDSIDLRVDNQSAKGILISISPEVDQATLTRSTRIAVNQDWGPGELAYVQLRTMQLKPGYWLPETAVTEGMRGTWVSYVAVPGGDGLHILESRSITIHHAENGFLYVSGALSPGDEIVTAGLHRVAPGQKVRAEQREGFASVGQSH